MKTPATQLILREPDVAEVENLARTIAASRFGAGHFDAKGTKRAYWRRQAREFLWVSSRLTWLARFRQAFGCSP